MKVKDLSGKIHIWNLSKYIDNVNTHPSQLHTAALNLLRETYPAIQILEEVYIPGENLYLDIYIPSLKTAVECQGVQHEQYNSFFYNHNKRNFTNAQNRDKRKKEWCRINNIRMVYFYNNEDVATWKTKL